MATYSPSLIFTWEIAAFEAKVGNAIQNLPKEKIENGL